ncbi:MAG: hypothetical protein HY320_00035, partial [Armatimonadetes bacterium]|nr:hypothetical protein [Armatimonadota bacterium]
EGPPPPPEPDPKQAPPLAATCLLSRAHDLRLRPGQIRRLQSTERRYADRLRAATADHARAVEALNRLLGRRPGLVVLSEVERRRGDVARRYRQRNLLIRRERREAVASLTPTQRRRAVRILAACGSRGIPL